MSGTQSLSNKIYYSVVGGEFVTRSHEGDPRAKARINKKGVKVWEVPHKAIFGLIEDVSIWDSTIDGKPVKTINITLDLDENGKTPVLTFGVESKNGRTIMERLPALDFSKEVRFMPFDNYVPPGETEPISGLTIHQKGEDEKYTVKIENHFYKDKMPRFGMPVLDWDKASESEKKIYGIQKTEFLLKYFTENVLTKFSPEKKATAMPDYPEEVINPEDIPF